MLHVGTLGRPRMTATALTLGVEPSEIRNKLKLLFDVQGALEQHVHSLLQTLPGLSRARLVKHVHVPHYVHAHQGQCFCMEPLTFC